MRTVAYISPNDAKRKLRLYVCLFVLALSIPIAILVVRTYKQLENENFYQHRLAAERVAWRMNSWAQQILEPEEKRNFDEYSFLNVSPNALLQKAPVTTSPLSEIPPKTLVPGVLGYFQIDPDGTFNSPILPELSDAVLNTQNLGFSPEELQKRLALKQTLQDILASEDRTTDTVKKTEVARKGQDLRLNGAPASAPSTALVSPRGSADAYEQSKSLGQKLDSLLAFQKRSAEPGTERDAVKQQEKKYQQRYDDQQRATNMGVGEASQTAGGSRMADNDGTARQIDNYRERRKESISIPEQSTIDELQRALDELNYIQREEGEVVEETVELEQLPPGKKGKQAKILTFEGEVDPIQCVVFGDEHLVFFRKAWRARARYVQGFIVEQRKLLDPLLYLAVQETFGENLTVRILHDDKTLLERVANGSGGDKSNEGNKRRETSLYSAFLEPPFDGLRLAFVVDRLPRSVGAKVIDMVSLVLLSVLLLGSYGIYRLGATQIDLGKQRSDFVSAVSHELKTPLTSIRMYGEMLRSGMVKDGEKLKTYYDFIFFESERLSRLISNVLQLARLTNNDSVLELKKLSPQPLLDLVRSKTSTQIEAAGFQAKYIAPEGGAENSLILAEEDAFCQIFINLVDNAIKFSAKSEIKKIELGYRRPPNSGQIIFFVRDHGPGIPKDQLKRIFQLFYRAENEMTRTTTGTGIGLALVNELAAKMDAKVDVQNSDPGAEFRLIFRTV